MSIVVVGVFLRSPAWAQPPAEPPGPYIIDVRAVTIGVPSSAAFYPVVPAGTVVPARALGLDVGGHIYFARLGPARVGVGANFVRAHGSALQPITATTSTGVSGAIPSGTADEKVSSVEANVTGMASQLSFSFGTRDGWSYLSAGVGTMRVQTEAVRSVAASTRTSGYLPALNGGAGARWFFTSRLAVGFDLRMYRVSARGAIGTPRVTLLSASAGLSTR